MSGHPFAWSPPLEEQVLLKSTPRVPKGRERERKKEGLASSLVLLPLDTVFWKPLTSRTRGNCTHGCAPASLSASLSPSYPASSRHGNIQMWGPDRGSNPRSNHSVRRVYHYAIRAGPVNWRERERCPVQVPSQRSKLNVGSNHMCGKSTIMLFTSLPHTRTLVRRPGSSQWMV